jgi:cellulose synthase/poly-beta-1,6-N-acetylglucosamine synthase-like glycosyltransferase
MTLSDVGLVLAIVAVSGVLYPHLLYPLLLWGVHRIFRHPVASGPYIGDIAVVIAAYNEVDIIPDCLRSIKSASSAPERLTIVLADDGSTDGTADVAESMQQDLSPVTLVVRRCGRGGKNAALRTVLPAVTADIVVFTDADCRLAAGSIGQLLGPFADASVGAVIGSIDRSAGATSDDGTQQEALYRRLEQRINAMESDVASTVVSSGALYAVRRELMETIPDGRVADDWWNVLPVVKADRRIVVAPRARVVEHRPNTMSQEYQRTVRTASSGMRCLWGLRQTLHPRYGWTSWFLWSHRIIRWMGPLFLLVLLVSTCMLVEQPLLFGFLFYAQFALYALAFLGHAAERTGLRIPVVGVIRYIVLMNLAFLGGAIRAMRGGRLDVWEPSAVGTGQ